MRASVGCSVLVGFSKNRGRIPGSGSSTPPAGDVLNYPPDITNATAGGSGNVTITYRFSAFMADGSTAFITPSEVKIYWNDGANSAVVTTPTQTSYTFNAGAGTKNFYMTAKNTAGTESAPSASREITLT